MTTDPDPDRPPITGWPDLLPVALGISPTQVGALRSVLRGALSARACSGTFRELARWARPHRVPWDPLVRGLRSLGARCDCEALEVVSRGCSC
ncbi:DUF2695 domain-containing protein [Pseudonocardia pini]|uniref:DUF2695 domain-containing protein n=1 Tax=Pseudonocardia pini TaxID=2758030 RepID=UPI0015F0B863|nr:DUF2695 domain-containing protein [Pseudonocardia pini]